MMTDFGILPIALALWVGFTKHCKLFEYPHTNQKETGITTEVAVMMTFMFGALVMIDQGIVAIALAVITALLLAMKGRIMA